MMKQMKLKFENKTFTALVDMTNKIIFSADIWHTYNEVCAECEDAPQLNFHDYVYEVLDNGHRYTSDTFAYYNPWESDDIYQMRKDDEENMTGESWTFFIPGVACYDWVYEGDFFEQLHHLVNQVDYKAAATKVTKRNNVKRAVAISA